MSWQRVRGHEAQASAFAQVVRQGRLAHAYLFIGPRGVGKRLFAGELARALLCEARSPERLDACDQCPSCLQIAAGTHPDFFATGRPEDKLELPIEQVQELCAFFGLKSARGRGKVAILDDADDLNDYAANCFLKTLEEPPPGSVLLLIGTDPERQLTTLVSRCQVVRFHSLPEAVVADLLRAQGVEQPALLQRLVRLGNGSPAVALELADPALWEFRTKLVSNLFQPRVDRVALAQDWTHFVEEAGKETALHRRRAALVLRLLIEFLRDALRVAVGKSPHIDDADNLRLLHALVERADTDTILQMIERCLETEIQLDSYVQLVLVLEALVDAIPAKL